MNGGANYHEGDPMQFYPMYDNPYYNQSTHSSHNTHNNTSNSKQAELISFDTKSKEPQKLKSSLVHRKEVDLLGEYERNYLNGGLVNNSTSKDCFLRKKC